MKEKILILGIGNYLLADEGVGVHTIKALEETELPEHVTLLDGGTGGFHLMEHIQSYARIIMIDATLSNDPPGTIKVLKPKFAKDFPKSLSAHDIGLKDMLDSIALLDKLPDITLITISITPLPEGLSIELSEPVKNAIPEIIRMVNVILNQSLQD